MLLYGGRRLRAEQELLYHLNTLREMKRGYKLGMISKGAISRCIKLKSCWRIFAVGFMSSLMILREKVNDSLKRRLICPGISSC